MMYLTKRIKRRAKMMVSSAHVFSPAGLTAASSEIAFCGMLLSSCSKSCKCGGSCVNKPFQYRPIKKMKQVKTEKCGSGLVAEEDIKQGDFVIEYVGEDAALKLLISEATPSPSMKAVLHEKYDFPCGRCNIEILKIHRSRRRRRTLDGMLPKRVPDKRENFNLVAQEKFFKEKHILLCGAARYEQRERDVRQSITFNGIVVSTKVRIWSRHEMVWKVA
ncbi:hypothetical protein HPP92_015145 [Vanilla planifolia]|uniref:Uncharacterized protein n=1 Tax=Vanilla planifolia TaxID=51239 RepID=A0A835UTE6_VANPL|nr:hypothetical protein HPP92_015145 [Vanilla planifolia]